MPTVIIRRTKNSGTEILYTFFSFVTLVSTPWFQSVLFYIKSYDIDTRWLMEREHFFVKTVFIPFGKRSHLQAICSKDGVFFIQKRGYDVRKT